VDDSRTIQLRAWAAWNDTALDEHGSEYGVFARREANRIADQLGDFTETDWGIIRNRQREYAAEASP
jgi:hypothetical protein